MSDRDTHFQGFAKLLIQEMDEQDFLWLGVDDEEKLVLLLAQHAYKLVWHTLLNVNPYYLDCLTCEEHVTRIPDLTEWPKQEEE